MSTFRFQATTARHLLRRRAVPTRALRRALGIHTRAGLGMAHKLEAGGHNRVYSRKTISDAIQGARQSTDA